MPRFDRSEYDTTFPTNYQTVLKKLDGKTIIYSVQFIRNEETQTDCDGPESTWDQFFFCVEKEQEKEQKKEQEKEQETDYVLHLFQSAHMLQSYSYPSFQLIANYNHSFSKLSDLKEKIEAYLKNIDAYTTHEISGFIQLYDMYTSYCSTSDQNFNEQLKDLNIRFYMLKRFNNKRIDKERKAFACTYEKYLQSDEYKEILEKRQIADEQMKEVERQKEEDRLQLLIKEHGEEKGRLYHIRF
jgi:hypothetical protein